MKLVNYNNGIVTIEFAREELMDICATVFSANSFYDSLDPIPYNLTEDKVSKCAELLECIIDKLR